ncbi:hypothetical protein AWB69_08708 [Caballeronia udeis]|uniref:Uncharacterized protein n=1 Tax=Caballeronia udeis TaxID=1232866 RepID=A0A158JT41_9BURK|nr:hypothetical protein AWB69_08708 [Caballeronia udeis]
MSRGVPAASSTGLPFASNCGTKTGILTTVAVSAPSVPSDVKCTVTVPPGPFAPATPGLNVAVPVAPPGPVNAMVPWVYCTSGGRSNVKVVFDSGSPCVTGAGLIVRT